MRFGKRASNFVSGTTEIDPRLSWPMRDAADSAVRAL